jgi:prophage antirepressor-like protein
MAPTARTLQIDGEAWFVGKDVADVLGHAVAADAIRKHCKAAKSL